MIKKSIAIFYSEFANSNLGSIVKSLLNENDFYTIYLKDLDDVLLKTFTQVNFLILDLTSNNLDDKSYHLINKLNQDGFIKRLLVIKSNNSNNNFNNNICVDYDENIKLNLSNKIKYILSMEVEERKIYDSSWVKIIGEFLTYIGFSLKHEGYSIMIDAIIYILSNNCIVKKLNKDLYVYLANKYNKKISCIEMNIRKSIKMAFERSKNFPFEYCPTNKEFIAYTTTELYDKIFVKKVI